MKKCLSIVIMLVMIISPLAISASAVDLTAQAQIAENEQVEYYEDGSYMVFSPIEEISSNNALSGVKGAKTVHTKSGYYNVSFYSSNDELQWTVSLVGTFSYDGSLAVCTSSSVSYTIYESCWKVKTATASRSGATAYGDFVVKRYTLLVPVQSVPVGLAITCSPSGVLSF